MAFHDSFDCANTYDTFHNPRTKDDVLRFFNSNSLQDVELLEIVNRKVYNTLVYLESETFVKIVIMLWKQFEDVIFSEKNVLNSQLILKRKEIIGILTSFQNCLLVNKYSSINKDVQNQFTNSLSLMRKCIYPLSKLDEKGLRKVVSYNNNLNSPAYFFLHTYLDIQWLLLCTHYLNGKSKEDIQIHLAGIMKDLLSISACTYKIYNSTNSDSNFGCCCIKKAWLKLQLFSENCDIPFWELINPLLNSEEETLSVWLILNIASLQGINQNMELMGADCDRIKPNFSLLESLIKSFLKNSVENRELLKFLKYLDSLINHWWKNHSKIDLYQILWDYFNKNINNSFTNEETFNSVEDFVSFIDEISSKEANLITSSYDFFLHMLSTHLSRNPNHWPRIKGRIYSRLPLHKLNDLNESGLYHIFTLFLTLSNTVNFEEITSKLLTFLENISQDKQNSKLIWNTYSVLIILHDRKKLHIDSVAEPLIRLVERTSNNRNLYYLIKNFVDSLSYIFKESCGNYERKTVLFGSWTLKYIVHCQQGELKYFVDLLCQMVRKIQENDEWLQWEDVFRVNILPGLGQIAVSSEVPLQVGELGGLICSKSKEISKEYVPIFTAENIPPKITIQFLNIFLNETYDVQMLPKDQETLLIQTWVRCSLSVANLSPNLTRKILKLSTISSFTDSTSCDTLHSFIKKLSQFISPHSSNAALKKICEICFGSENVLVWVVKFLKKPTSEELAMHVFTMFGLLFYHCAPLLYHKGKSDCLLSRLIDTLLLPTEFLLKGAPPHAFILNAVQRTWHLYVKGVFELDCEYDLYLERLLKDLIVRYLPHLSVQSSPIFKCLDNEKLYGFIFEKISVGFLLPSSKSMETNISKALKIITISIQNASSIAQVFLIIEKILPSLMEVIMFNSHKSSAVELLKLITSSKYYEEQKTRDFLRRTIIAIVEKHLAFNVNNTFQLLSILVKLVPQDVHAILPNIKKQVTEIERKRGVGFDNTLRRHLDSIEQLLMEK